MYDVIIIGGSYAGLSAALQLAHAHGFLGQDGQPPEAIAAKGRSEVLAYPTVTWREGLATEARPVPGGFSVRAGSNEHLGRRLILATGVIDELPAIPGLAEQWGKTAFFCPYCDGYELGMGHLGVLAANPSSLHHGVIVSEWAAPGHTTFFLNGAFEPNPEQLALLASHHIHIERERVVSAAAGAPGIELRLQDGRMRKLDGLFLLPRTRFKTHFAEQLGCELEEGPMGPFYKTDPMKETTVPGVFACGDVALPMPAVALAVADGVRAGAGAHQSLIFRPNTSLVGAPSAAAS
jgi:thioredoxin reductase